MKTISGRGFLPYINGRVRKNALVFGGAVFHHVATLILALTLTTTTTLPNLTMCPVPVRATDRARTICLFGTSANGAVLGRGTSRRRCITDLAGLVATLLLLRDNGSLGNRIAIPATLARRFQSVRGTGNAAVNLHVNRAIHHVSLLGTVLVIDTGSTTDIVTCSINNDILSFIGRVGTHTRRLNYANAGFAYTRNLFSCNGISATRSLTGVTTTYTTGRAFTRITNATDCILPTAGLHGTRRAVDDSGDLVGDRDTGCQRCIQ